MNLNTLVVPDNLSRQSNWVIWKTTVKGGKIVTIPLCPRYLSQASMTDPTTWSSLNHAVAAMASVAGSQLGVVLTKEVNVFAIALNACFAERGVLAEWALDILRQFPTYAEMDERGSGLMLFARGMPELNRYVLQTGEPRPKTITPTIEVIGWNRYAPFTGKHWAGTPKVLINCQRPLNELLRRIRLYRTTETPRTTPEKFVKKEKPSPIDRARSYLANRPDAVPEGDQKSAAFVAACVLVRAIGLAADDAFDLLTSWCERCGHGLTGHDLQRTVKAAKDGDFLGVSEDAVADSLEEMMSETK